MHRINWKYVSFLGVILLLYFGLLYLMPQKFNWIVTLYKNDKNPFGAYIFKSLAEQSWFEDVVTSNKTLFEMRQLEEENLLILCEDLQLTQSELETLYDKIGEKHSILISTHQMDTSLMDTLGVELNDISILFYMGNIWGEDTLGVRFVHPAFDTSELYWLPEQMLPQYFESYDPETTKVLAENTDGNAVLLEITTGMGSILLSSTPLVFSNFSMVHGHNHQFTAGLLSFLQNGALHWTEYYQMGRMESTTPLRYILSEPALKSALYLLMFTILVFILFHMRRKQRIIPVIEPMKNETLDFVKTVSRLYYQRKDHKNLAVKKILQATDHLKRNMQIDLDDDMEEVISKVSAKTGTDRENVRATFEQINRISSASHITAAELKILIDRLDEFLIDK